MNQVVKIVSKSGNGAIVYVPSKWLHRKVIITPIDIDIAEDLFNILKPNLSHVIGVYLYGSYSRNEQLEDSDIDVLVIADKKFNIKSGRFDIRIVDIKSIREGITKNPVIFYSIIRESKAIINQYLLEELKGIKKFDFSWFINSSKTALNIDKELLIFNKENRIKYADNASVYSIILRARGLYLMKCILNNKIYTNKDFLTYLINLGFDKQFVGNIHNLYRAEKTNKATEISINVDKAYELCVKIQNELKKYEKRKKG